MLDQIAQIKNLLESIVIESEVVAQKFDFERSERVALSRHCDFLRSELDMQDARNLDKSKTIDKLRKTQCDIEERELAMLSQLIDVQVSLDRIREKYSTERYVANERGGAATSDRMCDFYRGRLQAWDEAIAILDGMVQQTFWGDAE